MIGCDMNPRELLLLVYLLMDDTIPHGGGIVEVSYNDLQAARTRRNLILFGVPADIDTAGFHDIITPFLHQAMWKMREKNPIKYVPKLAFRCRHP